MTTTRKRTLAGAALLLTLSAGLAGCGDDDGDGGEDAGSSSAPSASADATSEAPSATTPPSSSTTIAPENADYCDEVTILSGIGSQEALDTEGAVEQLLIAIKAVAEAAPPEVADDWAEVEPAFEEYVEYVAGKYVDTDNLPSGVTEQEAEARNLATVQEAVTKLEPVQAQITAIGEHATAACGVGTF